MYHLNKEFGEVRESMLRIFVAGNPRAREQQVQRSQPWNRPRVFGDSKEANVPGWREVIINLRRKCVNGQ